MCNFPDLLYSIFKALWLWKGESIFLALSSCPILNYPKTLIINYIRSSTLMLAMRRLYALFLNCSMTMFSHCCLKDPVKTRWYRWDFIKYDKHVYRMQKMQRWRQRKRWPSLCQTDNHKKLPLRSSWFHNWEEFLLLPLFIFLCGYTKVLER